MVADFSGYATKAGLKCSDGRTIMPEAFKHMDGMTVPLVWQHGHGDSKNVLGHAVLEARTDGVYAYGYFNDTPQGKNSKVLVEHKDVTNLSIYANKLVEKSKQVFHGVIREVSLVLSGANPGALIDNITIAHGDGAYDELEDEAIIHTGLPIEFEDPEQEEDQEEDLEHAGNQTVQDIYDGWSPEEQAVVHYMVGAALEGAGSASHSDDNDEGDLNHQEGSSDMSRNVFEQQNGGAKEEAHVLTHDAMRGIVAAAEKSGSMKQAVEEYALAHGIDNMAVLFPDAQNVTGTPEFIKRRTEWVAGVLGGTHHTPFSRIKTLTADITQDEARAKGYIKGTYKKEEWFSVAKRTTSPTTVYKKQKLDRDDIIDITDFDIVAWMKGEMRLMLEEELAGAILLGDGRDVSDPDKIQDPLGAASGNGLRSIINDHELYVTTVNVNVDDANSDYNEVVESVLRARRFYKGTGTPTFYTTEATLVEMLLTKDAQKRRLWPTKADLAAALMVDTIVAVEIMETRAPGVLGIIVNLQDYNIGADKGGEVTLFDDFDIDYNQLKYLIETRISGALTKVKSALVIRKTAAANVLITPISAPTMNPQTYVVTVPTQANVVYKNGAGTTLTAGAQPALTAGQTLAITATPAAGFYFATSAEDQWSFFRRS